MRKFKTYITLNTALVLLMMVTQVPILTMPPSRIDLSIDVQNQEMEQFFKAKAHVFKREYKDARKGLERYLREYPEGQLRDEALYWLALSLNRLSREEKDVNSMVGLKEGAIKKTEVLINSHPQSLWLDDAKALRIEIAGELAMMGKSEYNRYIYVAVKLENKNEGDLKMLALNSLIRMEPETAIPTLKQVLVTDKDPVIRKKCVMLLGQNYSSEVVDALQKAAQEDPDPEVRAEAEYWIEQIGVRLIQTELSYYAFAAWAVDEEPFKNVPEKKLSRFTLPHGRPGAGRAQAAILKFFDGNVSKFGSTGSQRGVANVYTTMGQGNAYTRTSHRINNFQVHVVGPSIKKGAENITGQVHFQDLETREKYTESFTVNKDQDILFAIRRGKEFAFMLLQFETNFWADEEEEGGESWVESLAKPLIILTKIFGVEKEPIYYSEYSNWQGCKVETTLQTMDFSSLKGDKYDFSLAKATIPSTAGNWELTGNLIGRKTARQFLARMATLVDPKDKIVAVADQIVVPIDNPAAFEVTGSKLESKEVQIILAEKVETKIPDKDGIKIQGCRVFSERAISDLEAGVIDFGDARAEIPIKGKIWVLMGHLILLQNNRSFIATDARLINPDGHTVAHGPLLMVPIDEPQTFQVLKKESGAIVWQLPNL